MSQDNSARAKGRRGYEDLGLWGYFIKCMRLYLNGKGRARRKEYWSFVLFSSLMIIPIVIVLLAVLGAMGFSDEDGNTKDILTGIVTLASLPFIPAQVAVSARRLHDLGRNGWLAALMFAPYVGGLFMLVVALIPSRPGANKYGPSPFTAAGGAELADIFS